jgi:hypothetical protein
MATAPYLPLFQVNTPVKLGQGVTATSIATLYTVPSNVRTYVTDITACNTGSATATFDVYLVPATGTAGVANAIFYQCPLTANQTVQWTSTQPLFAGDTIQIKGSGTTITVTVGGQQAT